MTDATTDTMADLVTATAPGIEPAAPQTALRRPSTVMRLERMGSFFPTRLSFMRSVIRQLHNEEATVERPVWNIDADGFGHGVYTVALGGHRYSLIALSRPLDPTNRTDRVIANEWDTSYVLFDGDPTEADIARVRSQAPLQEAGRFSAQDLVLSRANKSVRLFEHVVERLARGQQPDEQILTSVGYLMRTTAVYGNGKFGIADRSTVAERPGMDHPFRLELLTVWLIRGFTLDLVEHVAAERNPDTAVALEPRLRRFLGIGNSTGLGMAPFLVSHPILINNWMLARETALARVRAIVTATPDDRHRALELLERAQRHVDSWNVDDERQMSRIVVLRDELEQVRTLLTPEFLSEDSPWDRLIVASSNWSLETQELLVGLVLEPHGELIDGLTHCMASTVERRLDPSMTVHDLASLIRRDWDWALTIDFSDRAETAQFWYVSEEKLEPRLGNRHDEPGAELEEPLDIARRVSALAEALAGEAADERIAEFLLRHPEHRFATRRVQTLAHHPYAEIRDNLIGHTCLPIDMLRSKLSFFGASRFDPRSDRWTRITLYSGAPLFDEITQESSDDWWLPVLEPA